MSWSQVFWYALIIRCLAFVFGDGRRAGGKAESGWLCWAFLCRSSACLLAFVWPYSIFSKLLVVVPFSVHASLIVASCLCPTPLIFSAFFALHTLGQALGPDDEQPFSRLLKQSVQLGHWRAVSIVVNSCSARSVDNFKNWTNLPSKLYIPAGFQKYTLLALVDTAFPL